MRYYINGLDCANCAAKIEQELRKLEGLEKTTLNFAAQTIELPSESLAVAQELISQIEPGVTLSPTASPTTDSKTESTRNQIRNIFIAALLLAFGLIWNSALYSTPFSWAEYLVFIPAYLLVGWAVVVQSFKNIRHGDWFDESFLMTIATFGAIAIHQLPEAVAVMLFYEVGEYLQHRAVNRSRRSIAALLKIQPDTANLKVNGNIQQVPPTTVSIGQVIIVRPGERVPLDGEIIEGTSYVDTSALTGESVPRRVQPGTTVLAGMVNGSQVLTVKVTKYYKDSSLARILELVEAAAARKSPSEQYITKFARFYTPLVVLAAVLMAFLPPLIFPAAKLTDWVYRALILLVISCPCALMISIPLGYFGGIGGAARRGILVKGANYLDALANVTTVVFDKTGTLTQGTFKVTQIVPAVGYTADQVLSNAAAAELFSTHPIAQSIRTAFGKDISPELVSDYHETAGEGISALINGTRIMVGNDRQLHRNDIIHSTCDMSGTVHVVINDQYAGYLVIADEIKPDAREAIVLLKATGIQKIVMLTGDDAETAQCIADQLGIDEYYAQLLPEDKVERVEALQVAHGKHPNPKLAFVGDGINDAPVISRADVGVAMGGLGSDAAIEAADVVLMEDHPSKLALAIQIARFTRRIIRQNIWLALGVKAFFIILGTIGVASIWEAVFADVGVTVIAVLNATRALKSKQPLKHSQAKGTF